MRSLRLQALRAREQVVGAPVQDFELENWGHETVLTAYEAADCTGATQSFIAPANGSTAVIAFDPAPPNGFYSYMVTW